MDNMLRMVGLARKAGRLEVGEEPVGAAARAHQARLIIVAADAADNTVRRAAHFAEQGNAPWIKAPFTKAELGQTVGRSSCAMSAITEIGMASSLVSKLALQQPELYGETAEALSLKSAKALRRQKEKRAHEKNVQQGKKKPWAAPAVRKEGRAADSGTGKNDSRRSERPGTRKAGVSAASPKAPAAGRPVPKGIVSIRKGKASGTKK